MRPTVALAPLAVPLLGVPGALNGALPAWALLGLLGITATLTTAHVVVTQIIRLRASARITRSQDALRVLEIEDLLHHHRSQLASTARASACRHRAPSK